MASLEQLVELRWAFAALLLTVYAVRKYRAYNRLSQFKGPFSTGLSNAWNTISFMADESHLTYRHVCERYGSIARIGPNDLVTSSPDLMAAMAAVRSPFSRTPWFFREMRVQARRDHIVSATDEKEHARKRQKMAAGYSGKENLALEGSIDECVRDLIGLIRTKYASTKSGPKPMDMARKAQYLALDVISFIGLGQKLGFLAADGDVDGYIQETEMSFAITNIKTGLSLGWILELPGVSNVLWPSEHDSRGLGKVMATARRLIQDRFATSTDTRSDMMSSFIRHGITKDELVGESTFQLFAGSDTTATTIRAAMLYLMTNPPVYAKLQKEIDNVISTQTDIPQGADDAVISDAECRKLPYLQAVLKETLRKHPPVSMVFPKRVPDEGYTALVDGKEVFLPGGTDISFSSWGMSHSKDAFGADADIFRPERWLEENDKEKLAKMNRVCDMIFGYGRYQCLGKTVAFVELGKVIFELLRNFDWNLLNPEKPWTTRNYLGVFSQKDLWVRVADRR